MSSFYVRPIDQVGEDRPGNGTMLEVFECFDSPCEQHRLHFDTLEEARGHIRQFKHDTRKPISSDKVNSFEAEGHYFDVAGEYPSFDEVEHFTKFLELKYGDDEHFDAKEWMEVVCTEEGIKMVCVMSSRASGSGLNPMVFDNIIKVEDVLSEKAQS